MIGDVALLHVWSSIKPFNQEKIGFNQLVQCVLFCHGVVVSQIPEDIGDVSVSNFVAPLDEPHRSPVTQVFVTADKQMRR